MMILSKVANDVYMLDTKYMGGNIAVIYLVKQKDKIAIIETGTKYSLPYVKQGLDELGLDFTNVEYVIPTHVHLDHAAGSGELMQKCKNARLIIHPSGAKHMIDPTNLIIGTKAVYGEEKFNELYGDIKPVEKDRVITADDNFTVDLNNRILKFIDTPGHAYHHFCIWDSLSGSMFTGDTFGISYREFDNNNQIFISPTTTPTQFEPNKLLQSIDKIMSFKPKYICLTHFGAINPTPQVVLQLKEGLNHMVNIAKKYNNSQDKIENKIMQYFVQNLEQMGIKNTKFCEEKLENDVKLNAQGLFYWQQKINK